MRSSPSRRIAKLAATAIELNRQKPIARSGSAWWPGGRWALKPTLARQSIQVYFEKPGDVPTGVTVDAFKYGPAPVPGQWATYKIPLADLGVAGAHIFKFAIQDETGLANNVFYLDNIGFLPATP